MNNFAVGQRWTSESEPELGLGILTAVSGRHVTIHFSAGDVTRQYAIEGAPLKRVQFRIGDEIKTQSGVSFRVKQLEQNAGLLIYLGETEVCSESELCSTLSFNTPEERLLSGHLDDFYTFDLRYETLKHQFSARKSRVRGFIGSRIDLIPHQLYLAHEMTSRHIPRVLLADEVGLGKTIEACLMMHRLLASGQVSRILILLPPALVHQWFVELIRRFNLSFHIFDREYCEATTEKDPEVNPFLEYQLGICNLSFLTQYPEWREAVLNAPWDMVVVDEAHHLQWSEKSPSIEYQIVETLAKQTRGLLLLSATPEQLGMESHFARLRLLDPHRYSNYESFTKEKHGDYQEIARISDKLIEGKKLDSQEVMFLDELFPNDLKRIRRHLEAVKSGSDEARKPLIDHLLDLHGIGRVMFRNTRKMMTGFPERRVHLSPLLMPKDSPEFKERLKLEFQSDCDPSSLATLKKYDYDDDARIDWLIEFLEEYEEEKVLLICRFKEKVLALDEALKKKLNLKIALFHEDLQLIRRDRNAAWFAEEDGAQILISSEIGSEGRNFQFAHHLILFDLPLDQELLEQRIGRLDRIGQTEEIHIHVPYFVGSPQEVVVRWYQEGLDAFEHNAVAGRFFDERFDEPVRSLALSDERDEQKVETLIKKTQSYAEAVMKRLEKGRDRLLELNSFRPLDADVIVKEISKIDQDTSLDEYMERIFDQFGIKVETFGHRTYFLNFDHLSTDAFPVIKREGLQITYDRSKALVREDIQFLSWDHPMVVGAMDLMLGAEKGNSAIALWHDEEDTTLFIEAIFVLECLAPPQLYVDRFFPATPIRVVVNQKMENCTAECSEKKMKGKLQEGKKFGLLDRFDEIQILIRRMLEQAQSLAHEQVPSIVQSYQAQMQTTLGERLERLQELKRVNDHVQKEEVVFAEREIEALEKVIGSARLRLDALRAIWKAPIK